MTAGDEPFVRVCDPAMAGSDPLVRLADVLITTSDGTGPIDQLVALFDRNPGLTLILLTTPGPVLWIRSRDGTVVTLYLDRPVSARSRSLRLAAAALYAAWVARAGERGP